MWVIWMKLAYPGSRNTTAWYWGYFHTVRSAFFKVSCYRTRRNPALGAKILRAAITRSTRAGSVRGDLN